MKIKNSIFISSLAIFVTLWFTTHAFPQSDHVVTEVIRAVATTILQTRKQGGESKFEKMFNSIDCNRVPCDPYSICTYLNLGWSAEVIKNSCEHFQESLQKSLSEEDLFVEEIIFSLPRPEICKQMPSSAQRLQPPGTLALRDYTNDEVEIISACLEEHKKLRDTVLSNIEELKSMYRKNMTPDAVPDAVLVPIYYLLVE